MYTVHGVGYMQHHKAVLYCTRTVRSYEYQAGPAWDDSARQIYQLVPAINHDKLYANNNRVKDYTHRPHLRPAA